MTEAATAIRTISAAEHTGKLVLSVPSEWTTRVAVPPNRAPVFRSDGSYIVTGGVGGLGLFLAAMMACGRMRTNRPDLAIATESTGAEDDCAATEQRSRHRGGVRQHRRTQTPRTDWSAAATATGLPLRGVLHAAAVVDDATLGNITDELIDRDWAPKVRGAWYLHQAPRRSAPGLVLQLLLGRRAAGLARTGRVRGGQQLAGRLHVMATQPRSLRPPRSPGARGPRSAVAPVSRNAVTRR